MLHAGDRPEELGEWKGFSAMRNTRLSRFTRVEEERNQSSVLDM